MSVAEKKDGAAHVEHFDDAETTVKTVKNVALADATSKQQPSLFTRYMFMVRSFGFYQRPRLIGSSCTAACW